jgi:predicted CXXCH cytochrome family protein
MIWGRLNKNSIRKINNKDRIVVWLIVVLVTLLMACSEKVGSGFVKFIFDGVPDKNKKDTVTAALKSTPDSSKKILKVAAKPAEPELYFHPPYKEKACTKCHNDATPGKIVFPQHLVCYTCHEDFKKKYAYVHGPVDGGFCTGCHTPHLSKNKKLLARTGQELCLNCHTKKDILQNEAHADIGSTSCMECHNPHGGSDRFILN